MPNRNVILCCGKGGTRTWGDFAADVCAFQARIATASHVLNLLADRYEFMVGLAAALLNGQTTVLPSSIATEAISAAMQGMPSPVVLGDTATGADSVGGLCSGPPSGVSIGPGELARQLRQADGEIHVFTSGSTTKPVRHVKNWAALAGGAELTAEILREMDCSPGTCSVIGTTPHQHMYGLEATVFAALAFSHCAFTGTVFYPADLEQAVAASRAAGFERCVLVTSPAHLKFLEATILATPEICGIISASAPLSLAQAERLEARGDLPVWEIYGTTETGSLAKRRPVDTDEWDPLAGFILEKQSGVCIASAPHLADEVLLGDEIELMSNNRFRLLGRLGDLVNVAGKRANLAALNTILSEAPGVTDGIVIRHRADDDADDVIVVMAIVDHASGYDERGARDSIRRQFLRYVDPIFLPRQISFVDKIPRTRTGKISFKDIEGMRENIKS